MDKIPEIKFILRFCSKSQIPAELVARILLEVEKSILYVESQELTKIRAEFPDLPTGMINTLQKQLDSGKLKGLYLNEAKSGSIILIGLLAGIGAPAYWLLNQTLGKDIENAWQKTKFSKRFQELLLHGSKDKLDKLIDAITKNIVATIPVDIEGIKFGFRKGNDGEDLVLGMKVEFTNEYPTTRGKLEFVTAALK
jgi:hypothetical protein